MYVEPKYAQYYYSIMWSSRQYKFKQESCAIAKMTVRGLIDWLSMVLRLRQHNIGYTADGFYRSDDPTNSVKALKEGG